MQVINDISNKTSSKYQTYLITAVIHEDYQLVNELIDLGIDINGQDDDGNTPLHFAVKTGNKKIVQQLLEAGAKVNLLNNQHWAPIHNAVMCCHEDLIELLVQFGNQSEYRGYRERRNLSFVNESQELSKLLYKTDYPEKYNTGGQIIESLQLIIDTWSAFQKAYPTLPDDNGEILNLINKTKEQINNNISINPLKLNINEVYLSNSGCPGHVIPFILTRLDTENFELRLFERGYLVRNEHFNKITKQCESILKLTLPQSSINMALKQLHTSNLKTDEGAVLTLFDYIPKTLAGKSDYIYEKLTQKIFKTRVCFWGNYKTLMLDRIINIYIKNLPHNYTEAQKAVAIKRGKLHYKKFDIFVHEYVLQRYQDFCTLHPEFEPEKECIIELCQKIIAEKYQKLENLEYLDYQEQLISFNHLREQVFENPSTDDIYLKLPNNPRLMRQF